MTLQAETTPTPLSQRVQYAPGAEWKITPNAFRNSEAMLTVGWPLGSQPLNWKLEFKKENWAERLP